MSENENIESYLTGWDPFVDGPYPELETPKPTTEGMVAAVIALEEIRNRSFSGRHPELGKMINCLVCDLRHRDSIKCQQKFVELFIEEDLETGEKTTIYATSGKTRFGVVGAKSFKGRRLKPHLSKRKLQFVELIRSMLPMEYTEEELKQAKKKAARILIKKFGRFGFLPRKSEPQPKAKQSV